jgi:MATE family multidrug resistance protein
VAATCLQWSIGTGIATAVLMLAGTPLLLAALPASARGLAGTAWAIAALSQPLNAISFGTDGIHWGTGDYGFLRNAMLLATAAGAALLAAADASGHATLERVWGVTAIWIGLRALAGTLRVWPGVGRAPLRPAAR